MLTSINSDQSGIVTSLSGITPTAVGLLALLKTSSRREQAGRVGHLDWGDGPVGLSGEYLSIYSQGCSSVYTTNVSSEASALECSVINKWNISHIQGLATWSEGSYDRVVRGERDLPSHVSGWHALCYWITVHGRHLCMVLISVN